MSKFTIANLQFTAQSCARGTACGLGRATQARIHSELGTMRNPKGVSYGAGGLL